MHFTSEPKLISGNANLPLAKSVARRMSMHRGMNISLVDARVERFSDQEIFVEVYENVRGEDMFIIQPTSRPANDNLMELLIITDALRRSSAARITAVIPYFGYARQDRRTKARTPISAKLVANLITEAGVERVLTMDLHAAQIQGFFDIPVDNLYASPIFALDIAHHFRGGMEEITVVSPDVGGVQRARELAKRIGARLAIVDKRRTKPGEIEGMTVIDRRHAVQGGGSDHGSGRKRSARLYHPRGAFRTGGGADRQIGDEEPRHHRCDRANGRGEGGGKHPHRAHGADVRPGDPQHLERHICFLAFRRANPGADLRWLLPA